VLRDLVMTVSGDKRDDSYYTHATSPPASPAPATPTSPPEEETGSVHDDEETPGGDDSFHLQLDDSVDNVDLEMQAPPFGDAPSNHVNNSAVGADFIMVTTEDLGVKDKSDVSEALNSVVDMVSSDEGTPEKKFPNLNGESQIPLAVNV